MLASQVATLEAHPWLLPTLKWLGLGSASTFVALWGALLKFPPELIIESTNDVSKEFNAESRLRIKNIGHLPAISIYPECTNVRMKIDGLEVMNSAFYKGPKLISQLVHTESEEIPVPVGFDLPAGSRLDHFSYSLRLHFSTRLIFFTKNFSKQWSISLKNLPDGYHWNIKGT